MPPGTSRWASPPRIWPAVRFLSDHCRAPAATNLGHSRFISSSDMGLTRPASLTAGEPGASVTEPASTTLAVPILTTSRETSTCPVSGATVPSA